MSEPQHDYASVRRLRPEEEFTDLGNARRLVEQHGRDLKFDHASKRWLVWDGRRWSQDDTGEVERRAKQTAQALLLDVAQLSGQKERNEASRHALRSMNAGPLRAMVTLAATEPGIPVRLDELDANPMLLNVANGILDLRTGQLRPHDRAALCTKIADVPYDVAAPAPVFEAFLKQVLPDKDLQRFIQRLAGYSLTGDTREQVLPIPYGSGRNGKSTLVELLRDLAGDYACTMPPDLLVQRRDGTPQPHGLMRLRGVRLVTATETEDGARLSVSLVKQLTGGDTITARPLYGEFVDFRPQAKFWLSTNHKPIIRDSTVSIWRRIRLIPFAFTVDEADEDKTLPERLREELPGILAWAVAGCLWWQQFGLGTAGVVQAATADYRADSDSLGAFLEERCLDGEHHFVRSAELFAAWQQWTNARGEHSGTATGFGRQLTEKGYARDRISSTGARIWRGLGLLSDTSDTSDTSPEEVT